MFIPFSVIHEGLIITVTLNVSHITSLESENPRNPDSGTLIFLRDGRMWESNQPLNDVVLKCNKAIERFGNQILVNYISENLPKPVVRRTKRK